MAENRTTHSFSERDTDYGRWLRWNWIDAGKWVDGRWIYNAARASVSHHQRCGRVLPQSQPEEETDGKYHIHDVNGHEPIWGAQDTLKEVAGMRGILALAIRASEILEIDAAMRPVWREFLEGLAPLSTSDLPAATGLVKPGEPKRWISALSPVQKRNLAAPSLVTARAAAP